MEQKKYRLIVADDETAIRRGICRFIDWESLGFEVAADFEDGRETLEYLQNHHVDVILTDIQMVEISGLEVARYVFENHLPVRVVIISGYKEFEYARQAIAYNVSEYILKPVHMEEVEKTFRGLYRALQEEDRNLESIQNRQQDLEEILPELQEQFWMSILLGSLDNRKKIIEKRELLHLRFSTRTPCAVAEVKLHLNEDVGSRYFQQKTNRYNLLNNIFSGEDSEISFYSVYLSSSQLKVVAVTRQDVDFDRFELQVSEILKERVQEMRSLLDLDMSAEIEKCFRTFEEMAGYYASRQMRVQHKNEAEYTLEPEDYERLQQKYQLIMDTINDGDFEDLDRLAENILFEFRGLPLAEVKALLIDMFSMLLQRLLKISSELWREVKENVEYTAILNAESREEVKAFCRDFLQRIMEIVGKHRSETTRGIIEQVKDYLKEHYGEDISLDMLAERYYLNTAYLSRLFKQYTGIRFTDYLIEIRMEKAKEMLLTGKYRAYEISQKVGYKSDKYFFRVFKQYTGQSPSEFCRSRVVEKG